MPFAIPELRPPPIPEPTPVVRVVTREDVLSGRPIFKAPALEFTTRAADATRHDDGYRPFHHTER